MIYLRAILNPLIFILLNLNLVFADSYLKPADFENETSKYKLAVFLSEKCPCSRSHLSHVQDLMKLYPELKVYGVISEPAQNEKQRISKDEYFLKTNFGFPIINDEQQLLVKKYKALKTPHVVLVRSEQKKNPEVVYEGGLTDSKNYNDKSKKYLELALKDMASGNEVQQKSGFCLGCYIRRIK